MKINSTIFAVILLILTSCGKSSIAPDPIIEPDPVIDTEGIDVITYFHEKIAFYQPFVYRFDTETQSWGKRIASHFSIVSDKTPSYLGFINANVKDSGINLFQMVTLYQAQIGNTNINTAGINAEKVLSFIPNKSSGVLADAPTIHKKGAVEVFAQQIKIRKVGLVEFFEIGISGEGTYDLETGIIDVNVHFNETAIGGPAKVTRKYKISKTAITF